MDTGEAVQGGLSRFFEYLPQILGALVILLIGYIVARVVSAIVRKALQAAKFDQMIHGAPGGIKLSSIITAPSMFISSVVFWLLWLGVISAAVTALDLALLNDLVKAIYGFIPNIFKAFLIFLVASTISAGSVAFILKVMGSSPLAKIISTVAPALILSIATFMILNELNIAKEIVNMTYAAIMAALALGLGLSFGLGSKDVMSQMLSQAYETSKQNAPAVKAEMQQAKARAKSEASRAADKVQS